MTRSAAALLSLALLSAGCTPGEPIQSAPPPAVGAPVSSLPIPPVPPGGEVQAVAAGGAAFGVALYARLRTAPGNVFISPLSLSTAFGMAQAGARGATAEEMADVLRFNLPPERLHPALGGLARRVRSDEPGARLTVANALWTQAGFRAEPDYLELTRSHYDGGVRSVDFSQPDQALDVINGWVAARTNNRIRTVLARNNISPLTRLVLTNAVYFKGDWREPFPTGATRDGPFHTPDGPVTVPLMRLPEPDLRHWDGGDFQAVELPYKGGALSMVVLLPKQRDGLPALEARLTPVTLADWLNQLGAAPAVPVDLVLPRFTVEARYELKPVLQAMGMRRAFQEAEADFSGMSRSERLLIEDVVHQTFVAVDETGTEAAAATGISARTVSARAPPIVFRADHPFLYLIRHGPTGALLFLGRLESPAAS